MEKISHLQLHFKKEGSIAFNRLSLFIERMFADFMTGGTFTGSIQTEEYLHRNISDIMDFEGLYSEGGGAQSWHMQFSRGNDKISVSFQEYQHEINTGTAIINLDVERNHKFKEMVLEMLDTQQR